MPRISNQSADGKDAVLNMIPAGGIFGEIALLDGRPRTADALAVSDCELMQIDRRDFIPLVTEHPEIALKLIEILCGRIRHTSAQEMGQIYVPLVNWLLAAATLGAVLSFGSSEALAGAYGIAVSLLMAITTLLAALVAIPWGYSPWLVVAVNGFFFVIDVIFFSANSSAIV